jgi:3-carboxy-cis,cis-muconate cycloisomerase
VEDADIAPHFDRAALDRLTDPANYLGLAPAMVDRVLAQSARGSAP